MVYPGITLLVIVVIIAATLLAVHIGFRAPRRIDLNSPADYGLAYEEIHIRTTAGKRLFAWWLPLAEPAPTLIILHGWGGNAALMLPMALPMHRAGMNILLLDARNHGRSDSDSFSSLPRFAEDAGAAVDWVKAHGSDPRKRVALLGHSVGAGAVLFEASRRDDIAAVISIAAFAHPEWMMRRYLARFWMPGFCKSWILSYVEWVIGYRYTEIAPMNTACRVQCPVLLVHGTADETVPVTDARAIRDHCPGKKPELIFIEGGRHDSVEDVEHHADRLVAFLQKIGFI
jgi:alpha-beta hydrolase superfamily lysophospholipase